MLRYFGQLRLVKLFNLDGKSQINNEKFNCIVYVTFLVLFSFNLNGQSDKIFWDSNYVTPHELVLAEKRIISKDSIFGVYISYYPNGNIEFLTNQTNGVFHGNYFFFNEDGGLRTYKLYDEGIIVLLRYYEYDSIDTWQFKGGKKHGYLKTTYDGKIIEQGYYDAEVYYPISHD